MSVVSAFDEAVSLAIANGSVDEHLHGATIEAARKVASMMDEPEWPIVRGKVDNVSPSVFLKYCEVLGLTPSEKPKPKAKPKAKLATIGSQSRYSKASNA